MKNNQLNHLGYTGSSEISLEDGCLHGRILFIDDLITYEAESVTGLCAAFEEAVNDYLEYCAETGKPANKPYSGTFNVRVGPELHKSATKQAYLKDQSLNEFVRSAIEQAIEQPKQAKTIHHEVTVNHIVKHEAQFEAQFEVPYSTEDKSSWQQAKQVLQRASAAH